VSRRDSAVVISTGAIRRLFSLLLVIAVLALVAVFSRQYLQRAPGVADQIDKNAYQAVFLTGGQVFFGHAVAGDEAIALTDVFYLAPSTDTAQPQQLGQLVKRGSELHGPREPMVIELRQVLFVENLRDDSQVVAAIKRFKSGEQPAQPSAPAQTQPPATGTARPSASR
jgi:hypothetical protein